MTWLTYQLPTGRLSVQVPPATPSAGASEGSSGDSEGSRLSPLPLPLRRAHRHLCRVIDVGRDTDGGVWYCDEMRH